MQRVQEHLASREDTPHAVNHPTQAGVRSGRPGAPLAPGQARAPSAGACPVLFPLLGAAPPLCPLTFPPASLCWEQAGPVKRENREPWAWSWPMLPSSDFGLRVCTVGTVAKTPPPERAQLTVKQTGVSLSRLRASPLCSGPGPPPSDTGSLIKGRPGKGRVPKPGRKSTLGSGGPLGCSLGGVPRSVAAWGSPLVRGEATAASQPGWARGGSPPSASPAPEGSQAVLPAPGSAPQQQALQDVPE